MFNCGRCGSSYNEMVVASLGDCPRCKGRDGVTIELESDPLSSPSVSSDLDERAVPAEASELEA